MKKILVLSLTLAVHSFSFAQSDVDMGEKFSLSGNSILFHKTEKADESTRPSAKIWHLEGDVINDCKKIRFWLSDPKTNENTDSREWTGNTQVVLRITDKGAKAYIVQDNDSTYLTIVNIQKDIYGVQMFSSPRKGAVVTKAGWKITKNKADELKGNEAYCSYEYEQPGVGSFVFWGFEEYQFRIISEDGVFNYETVSGQYSSSTGENIIVGLYDDHDTLIEKFNMWLDRDKGKAGTFLNTRNAGTMSNPVGQKGKVKKIFKHLQGNSGYVRIVEARYNRTDFDIKIPPVNKE